MSERPARRGVSRWLRVGLPSVLVLLWLVGGAVGGPYFGRVGEVATNDRSSFLPESAESTRVSERLAGFLGDDTIPAVLVVAGDEALTDTEIATVADLADSLTGIAGVADAVSPPISSDDGLAAEVFVPIDADANVGDVVEAVRASVAEQLPTGLDAWVTGPAGQSADLVEGFRGIDGLLLGVTLIAVFVILVIVYRSPLLPVLVLLTSTFALCVALVTVWWLAKAEVFVLNGQVQGILFILVIGAATDYALLYTARYREALAAGRTRWDATLSAWRGAFEPILASAGTVIAGLLCLLLSDLATNRALGPIASIGIVFAVLSALTFLPALLALFGRAAFWPFAPKPAETPAVGEREAARAGVWQRLAGWIPRRARAIWVVTTLVLIVAGLGVTQLRADGVPASDLVLGASESRDGQAVLGEHFPGGSGSPAYVIVPEADLDAAAAAIVEVEGVDSLAAAATGVASGQAPITVGADGAVALVAAGPGGTPAPAAVIDDGEVLLIVTLTDAADSTSAEETVLALRAALDETLGAGHALVGGSTAIDIDTNATSIRDRAVIIPVILLVILVILSLLLRSLLAPLLLVATTVLSFLSALGVSALVFNGLFDFPGADPAVPLYGFVFLVALGVDYNIFLMSRVREESRRHGTRDGILRGLVATGGVITSAGLVLAATFAALGVIPILFLAQLAFIVAFGVLLDTFVVRTLLVPALAYDLGATIWWPSRLWSAFRRGADGASAGRRLDA